MSLKNREANSASRGTFNFDQGKNNVEKPSSTPSQNKKKKSNSSVFAEQGEQILNAMTDAERELIGSKSHTLHFKYLLGLASVQQARKVAQKETVDCSTPVGIVLSTDETIDVPRIHILKNKETGIDPSDISYERIEAGSEFIVSYYEFMYLIIRPEYSGMLEAKNQPNGAFFSAKSAAFLRGESKLPTPTLNFANGLGSVKVSMVDIDYQLADGTWEIQEPFAEKFGPLLGKVAPKRAKGKKPNTPSAHLVAASLRKILVEPKDL